MKTVLTSAILCLLFVAATPSPTPDLSGVSEDAIMQTIRRRDELVMQRNTELAAENADLKKQLKDLQTSGRATNTIVAVGPDLTKEITALNSDVSSLKHQLFWARWKWALIGVALGIVGALAAFIFTKIGLAVSSTAAKLGLKAAIA